MAKPDSTPLMALLRAATADERDQLAALAGTTTNYLYALGGCHREQPRVGLAMALEDASRDLHRQTNGRTPIVTARELASMCALAPFDRLD